MNLLSYTISFNSRYALKLVIYFKHNKLKSGFYNWNSILDKPLNFFLLHFANKQNEIFLSYNLQTTISEITWWCSPQFSLQSNLWTERHTLTLFSDQKFVVHMCVRREKTKLLQQRIWQLCSKTQNTDGETCDQLIQHSNRLKAARMFHIPKCGTN